MQLMSLYDEPYEWELPFQLLKEREPHQNISHRRVPTWQEHCTFIRSRPYEAWYWFTSPAGFAAGCVYLSKQREIGIGVLKAHRGQGLASQAIQELMRLHPGRFLANINPANEASIALFRKLGFDGPTQITFSKPC
jgi:RimJ/RimL family protein N-acetyltransferase